MKEKEKLIRDTLSILLAEVRELEKMVEADSNPELVTGLVDKSMTHVSDLVEIHFKAWPQEVRDTLLMDYLKNEMQGAASKAAVVFCQIHAISGVKISTIAESAFKEAQQMCKEDAR